MNNLVWVFSSLIHFLNQMEEARASSLELGLTVVVGLKGLEMHWRVAALFAVSRGAVAVKLEVVQLGELQMHLLLPFASGISCSTKFISSSGESKYI